MTRRDNRSAKACATMSGAPIPPERLKTLQEEPDGYIDDVRHHSLMMYLIEDQSLMMYIIDVNAGRTQGRHAAHE
jgi:hypothetical protein